MPYELNCPLCYRAHRIHLVVAPAVRWARRLQARLRRRHSERHVPPATMQRIAALRTDVKNRGAGAKRKNFLGAVAGAWRLCAREAESQFVPLRRQRLEGLKAQAHMLMGTHPKCRSCGILFGPGHEFMAHAVGLCEWCWNRGQSRRQLYG
jgi:hypothetical protein